MDKPGLRDALPQPKLSDTRTDPFWSNLDSSLSAAAAQPSVQTQQRDLNVGLGDVARGVGAGALDLVGGIGELARQASQFGKERGGRNAEDVARDGGDYLEQARANMANKLSPVLDVVAGAGDLATSGSKSLNDGMSADAKEALGRRLVDETPEGRLTIGDGAGDIDVWAMKMAQGVGSLVPTLLAGGVTGVAAKASIGRAVTASMIKRGATQEVAEAVAAKTVSKLATGAAATAGATGSVGSAGVNTRDAVLGMSFDELAQSDTFRQAFTRIDQDQQTQHLSDEEKLTKAREETANIASRATMSDAKTWGAAAMGSMMGDAMLFKMLAGKAAAGGVLKSAAKGAAGEGIGETLEEGVQQYAVNSALNEVAGANIDPMKGVVSSALEGGLIGMGTGGAVGAGGGLRGGKTKVAGDSDAKVDPATVEDMAPTEQSEQVQANPATAPVDQDLASAVDAMAEPVVQEADKSPLGPSASKFDELRDVPAYLRRDGTADRFKGMAENSPVQEALAGTPAPTVDDLLSRAMSQPSEDIAATAISGQQSVAADDVVGQPTAATDTAVESVADDAAQAQPLEQNAEPSALDAVVGQLQTLRITRNGKPFASEKEAAMASRKGKEMPVPLNGGGFGVAEIAEVEQLKAANNSNAINGQQNNNQPQAEVSNEPITPVPAISSEGQGDQPGAGEPAAAGAGPAIAGLTDRAGSRDPADNTPAPPVPDGQQQNDQTLTAPAPDAGAAVYEVSQPNPVANEPAAAPTPWEEAIDDPDGTITLKGDVPLLKQWAKESGVKAIQGKGGMVVAKSSAAKVREYVAPATSEPVQQIEAARAEVAPEPTEAQKEAGMDIDTLTDDEVLAVADELGISHDDNPDDARWGLAGAKKDALSTAIERVRNPSSATPIKPAASNGNIVSAPPLQDEGVGANRAVSFSKQAMAQGDKPAKHLTRKEAELVTKEWFKQYRGASGIDVQIHSTQAELEQALGLAAKDGLIRRAAFDDDNGTLHVAADTIANPKRMREILRHEVLAHYGLANVLGDGEYTKLISRLIKSRNDPSMKTVWDWVDTHYADEELGVQAEEVIAHLAELEPSAWRRGWDTVAAWVTKALRMVGFAPDGITAAETRNLIEALGKKMKRGGPDDGGPDGGKKFSQEAEQPAKATGVKMSQTNTAAADAAMEKLNLGPKPDIIDNTKANIAKLRKVDRGVVESLVERFIKKANTEVLDALAPIKYAEDAAGITDAADSGYVAARMATGAASTMQATMLYGLPEWKDGVIQRKAGTGENDALLGIFSDLGADLHNWLGWMAGHRAELLMKQGRENLLSEQDIAALKGLGKGKEAKFTEAKARWNRLNAATLDLAQEAGLFTKEARSEFESEWYIPFFRESEDGDVLAPFKPKGIANQNADIKKLKGGEANTADLLENIFTSTSKLIDASMKNMAAQKTVWNLADTGIIEVVAKPNMMDWRALKNGKNLITVKMEGEDYMIKVEDPDLYRAMTFFDRQPFGTMVNMAASAKRILTAGVTASPEFMLRNFLRDSLSSWAISKDGFKPVIDSIKGVKKTLAMEGSTIDVMFSGASFLGGYVNGNDPGAMADSVRKSLRRKGMTPEQIARYEKSIVRNVAHAKGVVADAWEKYSRYGEALENANREAVYDAAIKAGKSHAQAAFESKDLMDFSMMGGARAIQAASMVLPFFNARIQGLGKLTRELRDNPREIAKRAGMITAMSLGLLAANWDDERYEELPDWDKDANWHFFVGDQHWRIPKPFEIGVMFGTIPERMVRAMGDKDTGAQFGKAVARAIGDTFALNPTPQIVKPMVEAAFNYDTFRGGPIDSPQDLAVQAEARYNEQTSLLMRKLGEVSGFSPKQLEHLVIGYTGTIGGYVMATADGLIRAASPGESASWRADEIPLVKSVYRGTGPAKSTQHMEQFYQMLNEVNQLKRTIDQYRSEGLTDKANELLDEQGGILKSRRSLSRTQQQVRVVRNKIELIQRDRTMNAEEKRRRIDELLARRNDLVYQAVNKNRVNWE
ncbi:LPD38 domain-containing protein [Aeromonas jandaei]